MTETEKLQQQVAEFETEVAGLTGGVTDLTQRLATATRIAEVAIALAERREGNGIRYPDDDATYQADAVDAEQQRIALETQLTRKRLAVAAALDDLQSARRSLAAAKAAARFVQLQSVLDELTAAAAAVDTAPTEPAVWSDLMRLVGQAQALYRECGGSTNFVDDPAAARGRLWGAHAVVVDWAIGLRSQTPATVPTMAVLLGLPRAAGLVRELMGAS